MGAKLYEFPGPAGRAKVELEFDPWWPVSFWLAFWEAFWCR